MSGNLLARLTAFGVMTTQEFKQHGRELFGSEPPAYSHRFLEGRLVYQIQKLVYDGLRPEIMQRSNVLSQQLEDGQIDVHRKRTGHDRSIADMRLIREWQGVEHTGIQDGRSYKLLPAVVWAIAGMRWNGWTYFGLQAEGCGYSGGALERSALKRLQMGSDNQLQLTVDSCGRHKVEIWASSQELSESPPSPAGSRRFGGAHGPSVHVVAAPCRKASAAGLLGCPAVRRELP
jgi:hypothetical protein